MYRRFLAFFAMKQYDHKPPDRLRHADQMLAQVVYFGLEPI
jgi:hypothetical protein